LTECLRLERAQSKADEQFQACMLLKPKRRKQESTKTGFSTTFARKTPCEE
jgi:hypothetical protein